MEATEAKNMIVKEVTEAFRPDVDGLKAEVKELRDAFNENMVKLTPQPGVNSEFTPKQIAEGKAAWYRHCLGFGRPWGEAKAWSTDVSHSGLELIPTVVANSITEKLDNTPFRKAVTAFPYSPKGTVPYENVLPVAYRMTTRGTAVTEAAPTHAEVSYATNGLMAWIGLDQKLIQEATPQTVQYLENALVRAIYRQEVKEWTIGVNGNKEMTGMTGRADGVNMVSGHLTVASITGVDILALFWALEGMYSDNAMLIAPNATLAAIAALNTTTVTYLNTDTMMFLGAHKVIRMPSTSFASPATTVPAMYFGDPSFYFLFQDGPIALGLTQEGYTAMTTDRAYVAAKVYSDGNLVLPEAMKALKYLT